MSLPASTNLTVLSVLKAGEWFRGLEQSLLEQLAQLSVIRNFSAGETLFQRGDRGDFV
jgi:CRP-like cAMP-binding protein